MNTIEKKYGVLLSAIAILVLSVSAASAQSSSNGYGSTTTNQFQRENSSSRFSADNIQTRLTSQSVSRNRFAPRTPPARSATQRPAAKPFSTISRGPAVSPYLALNNPLSQASDYYNVIRPQREQRRMNQQQQRVNQQLLRQNQANQHRLNEMAAAGPFDPRGSEMMAPTGHPAGHMQFGNYLQLGGYFPPPSPSKQE